MSFVNCSYPTIFMQNTGGKYVNGTKKNANSKKVFTFCKISL